MRMLKLVGLIALILCLCVCCFAACDDESGNGENAGGQEPAAAKIEGITLSGAAYTYDGTAKSLAVAGTLPEGVSVTYTNNGKTDAGTYSVTATLKGDGYETLTLTADLVIEEAQITGVTAVSEQSVYANGASHMPSFSGTLPDGVEVKYYVDEAEVTDGLKRLGTYTVKIVLDGDNYKALELPVTFQIKLNAAELAADVIDAFGAVPEPWELLPSSFGPQYHVSNAAPNYTGFVNVSNIPVNGIGKQMNVAYGLLNKTEKALSYVNTVMAAMNTIKTLYTNYLDGNPANYETYTGTAGGFTFTVSLTDDAYLIRATVASVNVEIYANTANESYGATVQLTSNTALKYTVSENDLLVAMDILDTSATQIRFTRDAQNRTVGYLYEYLVVADRQVTATSAMIEVGEDYTVVIGTKGDFIPTSVSRNCEIYDNETGRLVGTEVREDVEGIVFNTYWFPLNKLDGISSIKKLDEANGSNADTVYINGYTDDTLHTKLMGLSHGTKLASRRFDIEFKTMYFYTYNADAEEYEAVSYEIPMIFIQEEVISSFEADFVEKNEDALDGEAVDLRVNADDLAAITRGYQILLPIYDEKKDAVTYQMIMDYCKA